MNFTWSSQSCGSTSRVLVQRAVHDELVERVAERIQGLRSGPPQEDDTTMGAIVNRGQYDKVLSYLEIGRDEGAREVVAGGPATIEAEGYKDGLFLRPALFDGVDPGSRLAQEEIFGPILSMMTFDTLDDALRIANDVQFGLTAGIFTQNLRTAHRFARDVESGTVWVNDSSRHIQGAPFGGWKNSGLGREESFEELTSYAQTKNVNVNFG
jgi:betaine-aldehyde dehydrogenase